MRYPWTAVIAGTQQALEGLQARLERLETAKPPEPDRAPIDALHERLDDLSTTQDELGKSQHDLLLAVAEGIDRVDRAERRVAATVKRARKELKTLGYEDAGLEAEAAQLQLLDGSRSEDGGVQPVQPAVAEPGEQASSVRGVTVRQLQQARGLI